MNDPKVQAELSYRAIYANNYLSSHTFFRSPVCAPVG